MPTGVAIDLFEADDPLVHISDSESPKDISTQLKDFFIGREDDPKTVATVLGEYRKHDQAVVFQEMADYLSKMIPKLR